MLFEQPLTRAELASCMFSRWLSDRRLQNRLHEYRRRQVVVRHHVVVNHRWRGEPRPTWAFDADLTIAHSWSLRILDVGRAELTGVKAPVHVNRILAKLTQRFTELP